MNAASLAVLALIPMAIGPLPQNENSLTVALCNGGTITIPIGQKDEPSKQRDCHQKGCHAGACRV